MLERGLSQRTEIIYSLRKTKRKLVKLDRSIGKLVGKHQDDRTRSSCCTLGALPTVTLGIYRHIWTGLTSGLCRKYRELCLNQCYNNLACHMHTAHNSNDWELLCTYVQAPSRIRIEPMLAHITRERGMVRRTAEKSRTIRTTWSNNDTRSSCCCRTTLFPKIYLLKNRFTVGSCTFRSSAARSNFHNSDTHNSLTLAHMYPQHDVLELYEILYQQAMKEKKQLVIGWVEQVNIMWNVCLVCTSKPKSQADAMSRREIACLEAREDVITFNTTTSLCTNDAIVPNEPLRFYMGRVELGFLCNSIYIVSEHYHCFDSRLVFGSAAVVIEFNHLRLVTRQANDDETKRPANGVKVRECKEDALREETGSVTDKVGRKNSRNVERNGRYVVDKVKTNERERKRDDSA
ncbi:hypothetical protein CBL_11024 [Carabus blaptoides fortunei]